jgi:NTP pyrophosphatase (non-canonical NTP hydrolase)
MSEKLIDAAPLAAALQAFADERDWNRFHSPKNLAMALTGEVGELVELFQWTTEEESRALARDAAKRTALEDELADVQIYLVRLASVLGIDMNAAVERKLAKNREKYPAPRG